MKVYVVITNHHPASNSQNYTTDCKLFLDKEAAEKFREMKENEKPYEWGKEYNKCTLLKKHL